MPLRPVAMGIMTTALLVLATSICTDEWYNVKTKTERKFNGLWNHCIEYKGKTASCRFLRGWEAISMGEVTNAFCNLCKVLLLKIKTRSSQHSVTGYFQLKFMPPEFQSFGVGHKLLLSSSLKYRFMMLSQTTDNII